MGLIRHVFGKLLSLYSTATQNTWCRGLAFLRWRYQHVGIFWRYLTLKFAFSPTPTPNASQWNIGCVGSQRKILALAMYISWFFLDFICVWYPTRTPFPVEYGLNVGFFWFILVLARASCTGFVTRWCWCAPKSWCVFCPPCGH